MSVIEILTLLLYGRCVRKSIHGELAQRLATRECYIYRKSTIEKNGRHLLWQSSKNKKRFSFGNYSEASRSRAFIQVQS